MVNRFARLHVMKTAWLLLGLVGCGGETGGAIPMPTTPPVSYGVLGGRHTTLQATWGGAAKTDPATLPISGMAAFDGVMRLTVESAGGPLKMNGMMRLTANFTGNSIGGQAFNFVDENELKYGGILEFSGGALDRGANIGVDYTFSSNIDGTLSGGQSFGISGDLSGDFIGPGQQAVSGVVSGVASSGIGSGYMFGDFIAGP